MKKLFDEIYLEKYNQKYGISSSHPLYPLYLEYQRPNHRRQWEISRRKKLVRKLSKITNLKSLSPRLWLWHWMGIGRADEGRSYMCWRRR